MEEVNLKKQFDDILKVTIAPTLKQMGFKKKGLHFCKEVNDIFQCFNIQINKWNSYNEKFSFTFNIGFYCEKINNVLREKEESNLFPQVNDCFIQLRIRDLTQKIEHWYELSNNISFEVITSEVTNDIELFLLPHFEKYNSLEKLKDFVGAIGLENNKISSLGKFVFLMITNQIEAANKQIREEYKNALEPQSTTHTINYPNGTSKIYTYQPSVNEHFIANLEKYAKNYGIELKK